MKRSINKRLAEIERRLPPVYVQDSSDRLSELLCSFVTALGGRRECESWANAAARLMGITTLELKASLQDGTFKSKFVAVFEASREQILAGPDGVCE